MIAENDYPVEAKTPFAGNPGKPLNNFVTELCRASVRDGTELAFDNPRDGWVYVGFADPQVRGEVSLDGERVVTPRDGESCDTLRFVAAGRHVVERLPAERLL